MTELDIMKHAKSYLDSLSQGIDPISGQPVPGDSVLNNVRLEKCFRYVSGVLEQVIANGGKVVSGAPVPFYITPEELQCISPAQEPLRISQLAKLITDAVDDPQRIPLRATVMTDWLLEKGFIEKRERPDGKFQRLPTPTGESIGISVHTVQGQYGSYESVDYAPAAQRFLLDHLLDILQSR